jgi:hypothetical protein
MKTPINSSDYYDSFPSNEHAPGDVWAHFPTFGVLPFARCSAVVLTPACDLANRKVESLTYVPAIPVLQYLASRDALAELLRTVEGQLQAARSPAILRSESDSPLHIGQVRTARSHVQEQLDRPGSGVKERQALARALSGLRLAESVFIGRSCDAPALDLRSLFGESRFRGICSQLVTNAYRTDVHFLPADGEPQSWSALPSHSLALFRYPLTLPIELLDLATTTVQEDWAPTLASICRSILAPPF